MGQKWCFLAIFVDTFWRRDHDFSVKKWYFVLHFWTTFGAYLENMIRDLRVFG